MIGNRLALADSQKGSVLIIVLWISVLLTILVTAMAGKVRLSAQTVTNNQYISTRWAAVMGTVHKAEMELMLEMMAPPIDQEVELTEEGEARNPRYRFNGEPLSLHYPQADEMVVRIYDHAGKINLNRIPRRNMQMLIEKRLGGLDADPVQVQDLLSAWTDWTDLNNLEGLNGAEEDYYQSLESGYSPRNNPELDTVDEILHIRGFDKLLEGVNLEAAFTIYGNNRTVNLNLATREAMELLPGLNDELVENILAFRGYEDINNRAEIAEVVPFENLQELSAWIGTNTSQIFSVYVYPRAVLSETQQLALEDTQEFFNPDSIKQAYMEVVEVRAYTALPRLFKVDPHGYLPNTAPPRVHPEDYLFDYQ